MCVVCYSSSKSLGIAPACFELKKFYKKLKMNNKKNKTKTFSYKNVDY